MSTSSLRELKADPENRRRHNPRNLEMLRASLQDVGASRSIVIDEEGTILAGNGVVDAAIAQGLDRVQIIDASGDTIIAVRRSGLSAEQKRALAIYDNRTAELAEWAPDQLRADELAGLTLAPWFSPEELAALSGAAMPAAEARATLAERFGVPPFSVLDARQGYWQERKRAWLALGIQSEIGRGEAAIPGGAPLPLDRAKAGKANATPGGAAMPAANYGKNRARGDGRGRPIG
jgi:hypothetical protein